MTSFQTGQEPTSYEQIPFPLHLHHKNNTGQNKQTKQAQSIGNKTVVENPM